MRKGEKTSSGGAKKRNNDNGERRKSMSRELQQLETTRVQHQLEVAIRREEKSRKEQKERDEKAAKATANGHGARRTTSCDRTDRQENRISGGKNGGKHVNQEGTVVGRPTILEEKKRYENNEPKKVKIQTDPHEHQVGGAMSHE